MKKLLLFVLAVSAFVTVSAQNKQLKRLTSSHGYSMEFYYDDSGRITSIISDDEQCSVAYNGDQISITVTEDGETWYDNYSLSNGLLTNMEGDDEAASLYYDTDNRLIKFDYSTGGSSRPLELIWQDGNIVETKRYSGSTLRTHLSYTHNSLTAHPLVLCLWGGLDFIGWPDAFVLYPYMGTLPINLIAEARPATGTGHTTTYDYETNDDGDVVRIMEYTDGNLEGDFTLEWESSSGISSTTQDRVSIPIGYYSVNGVRSSAPWHGMNIVRHADGTVRKVAKLMY